MNKKRCYVIMPFSKTRSCTEDQWADIFTRIIKPSIEESGFGYLCARSKAGRENIIKSILNDLNAAHVVIADLTDNNPNVFYELGVRHTLRRRTILIAQKPQHIPFDLKPYPTVIYDWKSPVGICKLRTDIREKLQDIECNPERDDNPVVDFLSQRNIVLLSQEKSANLKKLTALLSELSYNLDIVDRVNELLGANVQLIKKSKIEGYNIPTVRFQNTCLKLLLSTSYVLLPESELRFMWKMNYEVEAVNFRLDYWSGILWDTERVKNIHKDMQKTLPMFKEDIKRIFSSLGTVFLKYGNDNYVEPPEPIISLASGEHKQYVQFEE